MMQSASPTKSEQLLSIPETCAILGVKPTKCWSLIARGDLDVVRLGARCTRVKKSSIERLIHNGCTPTGGAK